jgi:hypothetical protein
VLHPDGFLIWKEPSKEKTSTRQLAPWAIVTFSNTSQGKGHSADFTCNPVGTGFDEPTFRYYSVQTHGKSIDFKLPPGKIAVSRTIPMENGSSISQPAGTLTLKPGERHVLDLEPASNAEIRRANELYERLNKARQGK